MNYKPELLFNTSIALMATALTIVSLIQINKDKLLYFLDELFVVDAAVFSLVVFLSYYGMSKGGNATRDKLTNVLFLASLAGMLIGSVLLTFAPN